MPRLSDATVITTNAILALIALATLCYSVYLFSAGPSHCQRFIQDPLIVTASLLLFISSLGLIAALYDSYFIMTIYLFLLFLSFLLILILSIFVFLVTNPSAGKAFSGTGKNWEGIKRCMSDSKICRFGRGEVHLDAKHLSSVKFGCCRPPVECGFESKNATWWKIPATSTAEITGDCKIWSNTQSQLCYACESCKIDILLVFNLLVTLLVILLYSCGCCVRNNNRVPWKRRFFR
ncbi:hypothetical protein Bca52824_095513 [Brassica carinata]|uniref:Uncharacterized protein n=1 Tax=Brassica carinata TaxID=52824 RepID=A0A8X7P2E1_BRACI|nr:hypothetical protein Bca52824_095513 [Brassica carinata]